jgi:hypothetical protein
VQKALENNKWIAHISPLHTVEELQQYITLWEEIWNVPRDENWEDEIKWRWTQDSQYTTQSAYQIQFVGWQKKLSFRHIWAAKTEPKVKLFVWILIQHKILTANNLAKRGWLHEPVCKLCNSCPETPIHFRLECTFTRNVWIKLTSWMGRQDLQVTPPHSLNAWWKRLRRQADMSHSRSFDGMILFFFLEYLERKT